MSDAGAVVESGSAPTFKKFRDAHTFRLLDSRSRDGFTLVELLIVLGLLVLLAGLSFPPIFALIDRQRFEAAANAVRIAGLEARTEAQRRGEHVTLVFVPRDDGTTTDAGSFAMNAAATAGSQPDAAPFPVDGPWADDDSPSGYAGGRLVLRPFQPLTATMAPDSAIPDSVAPTEGDGSFEGAPSFADLFATDDSDGWTRSLGRIDRSVAVRLGDRGSRDADRSTGAFDSRFPGESGTIPDEAAALSFDDDAGGPGAGPLGFDASAALPSFEDPGAQAAPWWYDEAQPGSPVAVVASSGAVLWQRPVTLSLGGRRATITWHPISAEPIVQTPGRSGSDADAASPNAAGDDAPLAAPAFDAPDDLFPQRPGGRR